MKRLHQVVGIFVVFTSLILASAIVVQQAQAGLRKSVIRSTPQPDGPDYEDTVVTHWESPREERPITYAEWHAAFPKGPFIIQEKGELMPLGTMAETVYARAIYVLVNSDLYDLIQLEVTQYLADLQNEGYTVYWATVNGGTPSTIRDYLRSAWNTNSIEGAILIGDFPVPWYEMDDDFDDSHSEFPIDLYYMDLDGYWSDADGDDLFDSHTDGDGNVAPEIYVTRLTGSPLSGGILETEAALTRNYFKRNHVYRTLSYYNWIEIDSTGVPLTLGDDGYVEVSLPFPFTFYGATYNSVFVSSNGFLSFGEGFGNYQNTCLPDASGPNNAIYGFWDDLNPATSGYGAGTIYYGQVGEDMFVVEWDGVQRFGTSDTVTFEILLRRDGTIAIQYKSVSGFDSATIGLENNTGTNAIEYACNGTGGSIEDDQVLSFSALDSYAQSLESYDWQEISSTGTPLTLSLDDYTEVTLPFSFAFYSNTYTSTYASSNGFLSFGAGFTNYMNTCLPNTSEPNNAIYGFWDDLWPASGGGAGTVYYEQLDSDTFVVEWDGVQRWGTSDTVTFEIVLHRNGTIVVQYNSVGNPSSATAGVESSDSSRSIPYACDGNGGSIHDELALRYDPVPYVSPQPYGLAYIDDDWAESFGNYGYHRMDLMYGADVDVAWVYTPTNTTTRNDYLAHEGLAPQFVHVMSHGYPGGHSFREEGDVSEWVSSSDVAVYNPPSSFYNLFVCSGARYVESDYVAGTYILDPYDGVSPPTESTVGLVAVGSTKTGSMLQFEYFYEPLGVGHPFGQAYLAWLNHIAENGFELNERRWHYGMTMLGDPTLRLSHPNNPVPTLSDIDPTSTVAGSIAFTLNVTGTSFVEESVVRWNGTDLTTRFVNDTQLSADVPASYIATAGTISVIVFNPEPGGGLSNALSFTINNPAPSLDPSSAIAGDGAFALTVSGVNFVNGSIVRWDGIDLNTTFASSTQLVADVPASHIATAGTVNVTVFNPAPGGGTSSPLVFTVNNPAPASSDLSPSEATAGDGAFALTVNGVNFVNGSIVRWDGTDLSTTFASSTQLVADVLASHIATAGTVNVTVFNPAPGGGTSGAIAFTINASKKEIFLPLVVRSHN